VTSEELAAYLKGAPDDVIRGPLWGFPPAERKAVIHERRRRFGVYDDEGANPNG
jgi:hypothetical protein